VLTRIAALAAGLLALAAALLVAVLRVERGLKRPGVCPVSPEPFSPGAG